MGKQRKRYSAQFVTDHRVLFLETICVSPVVFLADQIYGFLKL